MNIGLDNRRKSLKIAAFLEADKRIDRVLYPGLPNHPGHEIARQQMDGGFGGMLSFEVAGDFEKAKQVVESTKLFQLAVSLGAVESLIEQPLVMSYYHCTPEEREQFGIQDNMIRMSCGIEDADDLIEDLKQALEA